MGSSITVIICAHNEEKLLPTCLTSLAKQTIPVREVIVVDDRSSDQTYEVAQSYRKILPVITVRLKSSEKGRMKDFRIFNHGLKFSDFEFDYLAKIDADFKLESTYFEKIISAFQNDTNLGITSGMTINEPKSGVRGGNRVYRRQCWDEISDDGFTPPITPEDTYLSAKAECRGWKVQQAKETKCINLRPFKKQYNFLSRMKWTIDRGRVTFLFGYHPLFFLWSSVRISIFDRVPFVMIVPLLLGWIAFGWINALFNNQTRIEPEIKEYFRETQLNWLISKTHRYITRIFK